MRNQREKDGTRHLLLFICDPTCVTKRPVDGPQSFFKEMQDAHQNGRIYPPAPPKGKDSGLQ